MLLQAEGLQRRDAVGRAARRVVAQLRIMQQEVDGIEAEAVDAARQPELGGAGERVDHRRMAQIEGRLARQEMMEVVLAPARLPAPGGAAEYREPIAGWRAVRARIAPHIPVVARRGAAGPAVAEPRMLVGGMAADEIDQHFDSERMGALDQPVKIVERAEDRIDRAMIGHVIAEVAHRREEERREPHRVDAERRDIVELRGDAGEVADAVAVRVAKAARIDLIDDGAGPPFVVLHARCSGPSCFFPERRYRVEVLSRYESPGAALGGNESRSRLTRM